MPRNVKLRSLPAAFEMMMGIQVDGLSWGEDCRPLARKGMVRSSRTVLQPRSMRICWLWPREARQRMMRRFAEEVVPLVARMPVPDAPSIPVRAAE